MRPLPFDRKVASELLRDNDTFATVLHIILLAAYGDELYGDPAEGVPDMDAIEIIARVEDDFRVSLTEEHENKINAIRTAVSTDLFYEDPNAMAAIAMSLYDGDMDDIVAGALENVTVPEILWAAYEVEINRDDEDDTEFHPRVTRFIAVQVDEEREEHAYDETVDTLEEARPYHVQFVEERQALLEAQLNMLGASLTALKSS